MSEQYTRPQPAAPKAEPWAPPDLAEVLPDDADTIKGLTAEVDAALRRIKALDSNVQKTYRDTAQRLRTMEENWRLLLDARLGDIKRIENVERLFPTWKPLEPTALQMDAALRRINALEVYMRDLGRHIDILMQNEARIEALEAVVGELRRE